MLHIAHTSHGNILIILYFHYIDVTLSNTKMIFTSSIVSNKVANVCLNAEVQEFLPRIFVQYLDLKYLSKVDSIFYYLH